MLLLAIATCWILILAFVAVLCLAASRGDAAREARFPGPERTEQWPSVTLGSARLEVLAADPEAAACAVAEVRARREHAAPMAPVARVRSAVG
jgi:hypothetical protein